jgi:hypothetical protein
MHKRGRKVNGFKMIDEGNIHDFATNDLLRYQKSMAERIIGLGC